MPSDTQTQTQPETAVFPLLTDPAGYEACPWDLAADADFRPYWMELFRSHFVSLLEHAAEELADRDIAPDAPVAAARDAFHAYLDRVEVEPDAFGRLDVLSICEARELALRDAGIADPYRLVKTRENARALGVLPALLAELDALPDVERHTAVIEGVFAGNIFDMGAAETLELFKSGSVDFSSVRAKLKPRPFDALDPWLVRMADAEAGRPYHAAVLFVDNAGPDVVLGMLPLARELVKQGTTVVLSANTLPSLNDVTHDELVELVERVSAFDPVLDRAVREGRLWLIASGNGAPLIDLSRVAPDLASVVGAFGVDLVVLEGMGRSIESNFDAAFTCDALWLAMLKDEGVARHIGAEPFDLVMRFAPA